MKTEAGKGNSKGRCTGGAASESLTHHPSALSKECTSRRLTFLGRSSTCEILRTPSCTSDTTFFGSAGGHDKIVPAKHCFTRSFASLGNALLAACTPSSHHSLGLGNDFPFRLAGNYLLATPRSCLHTADTLLVQLR